MMQRTYPQTTAGALSLPEKVMGLTSMSMLLAMLGANAGSHGLNTEFGSTSHWILWLILEFVLLIATIFAAGVPGVGVALLMGFAFSTGVVIAPTIQMMVNAGQGDVVTEALLATGMITLGLTVYARTTKRDFSGMGGYLFAALLGLVVIGVLNIFIRSSGLYFIYSAIGVILFSLYLVYDVQRVTKAQDTRGNAVRLALSIYLDILNLFMDLLALLSRSRQ